MHVKLFLPFLLAGVLALPTPAEGTIEAHSRSHILEARRVPDPVPRKGRNRSASGPRARRLVGRRRLDSGMVAATNYKAVSGVLTPLTRRDHANYNPSFRPQWARRQPLNRDNSPPRTGGTAPGRTTPPRRNQSPPRNAKRNVDAEEAEELQ